MLAKLTKLVVVAVGLPDAHGVAPVTYQANGKILGHIFPTGGKAVIVVIDDWAKAQYCRDEKAAVDWLARNE